jgi:mannose-6-phosphate isomerase-like protein (cupin superfamily)
VGFGLGNPPPVRTEERTLVHIKASEVAPITFGDTTIKDLITSGIGAPMSVAHVKVDGVHPPSVSSLSDRAFVILHGSARIRLDNKEFDVESGDAVYIPKGTIHAITGSIEYMVVNVPPFDPTFESSPE